MTSIYPSLDKNRELKIDGSLGDLISYAKHDLDFGSYLRVAELTKQYFKSENFLSLGVIGGPNFSLLENEFIVESLREGMPVKPVMFDYNTMQQWQYPGDTDQFTALGQLDIVFLGFDLRLLGLKQQISGSDLTMREYCKHIEKLITQTVRNVRKAFSGAIIVQNFAIGDFPMFGSLEQQISGSRLVIAEHLNERLLEMASRLGFYIFDLNNLVNDIGKRDWFDEKLWNLAKIPFSPRFGSYFASGITRIIRCLNGGSKKCLVLDLDNTLWGGVIGDDGLEGIDLGQGSAIGEAFVSFQRVVKELHERGIVLCVCSKNEESNARLPFEQHSEMVISLDDIAVFCANWEDKATNILKISQTLNLGLGSFVFVDDNQFERELVRRALPEVSVPELPEDPALFGRYLLGSGLFEQIMFSDDDLIRTKSYKTIAEIASIEDKKEDFEAYLGQLEMMLHIYPMDSSNLSRNVQLISKSNQFNLTTLRYSSSDLSDCIKSSDKLAVCARLEDKYCDNGIITSLIVDTLGPVWIIELWVMSCRVLKRGVENLVIDWLVEQAKLNKVEQIKGIYRSTKKNSLVKNLYGDLGFSQSKNSDEGSEWIINTRHYVKSKRSIGLLDAFQ